MKNQIPEISSYTDNLKRTPNAKSILDIFNKALSALKKPAVAVPSILYFILQIIIILFYLLSINEPWSSFWAIFIKGISSKALGHYPNHIILMQPVLGRFNLFIDIFIHVIFQGATVLMISSFLTGRVISLRKSFSLSLKRYIHLAIVSIAGSAAIFACINISRMASRSLGQTPHMLVIMAGIICGLMIQALLLYTTPLILLKKISAVTAIKDSISIASRLATVSLLIVILPFILTLPSILLDLKAGFISLRLSPSFMIYHHIVKEVLQTISTYLITAGSAVIFISYKLNRSENHIRNKMEE
ncbi:hypothetical protein J7M07_08795 [bacterium]|nr:hypothetical protein [bacterium]